jgi:hypothetical protein
MSKAVKRVDLVARLYKVCGLKRGPRLPGYISKRDLLTLLAWCQTKAEQDQAGGGA